MFGARVVRQKRERERAERGLLDADSRPTVPYIKVDTNNSNTIHLLTINDEAVRREVRPRAAALLQVQEGAGGAGGGARRQSRGGGFGRLVLYLNCTLQRCISFARQRVCL